ncbi:MAG: fumarate reductase/succinate dehydrogenase flavoprotein subunit [Desulfobacterales bacterium]|jgi:succinate dehydrogenase / fumarate reductase flavoprotein subunit|nr:fumarate reductase/succinate dehydrogenase flavoprotein subunit [Desulfobacterales bacterium]
MRLDAKIPAGPLSQKWDRHRFETKLVNPANKRKFSIIVVGTGLAGASASASLAELGYDVKTFCIHDSPRRAHSIAAQGGINAAKNYPNDGDSVWRLFYDTVKGGDFRAREANVYRLAQVSNAIIDHCAAQGIPFAREYGGLLANRSFGGAQLSRTFYARGQTGQQLLLGAYSAMMRQAAAGKVQLFPRREMLDLVVVNGQARGIVARNLLTGEIERHAGHAVLLCTGGYGNVYFLSTNAKACNVTATYRAYKRGALFANPCFTQIHPTCIPVHGAYQSKLTLMSESLRNDGRVWVPKTAGDKRAPTDIPEAERDYFLERKYPSFGNLVPRDVASRNSKEQCDQGKGVGETGLAVYLDFADAIQRDGRATIAKKYGNLFQMYEKITGDDPYRTPMMIYPAVHYTMGGLWVDYNLMSTVDGLFVLGEANFSDHGANRLGASALMQGLADGYFVIPATIGGYLAGTRFDAVTTGHAGFADAERQVDERARKLLAIPGKRTVDDFHRQLGLTMWNYCGMSRTNEGLGKARALIRELRAEFWQNVRVPGSAADLNQSLEKAGRVADFMEFAELLVVDALARQESCGGHFNEAFQTEENEARRDDQNFCHVAAWEYTGDGRDPSLHKEPLSFENVQLTQRSYK